MIALDASLFTGVYQPTEIARYFRADLGEVARPWKIRWWARRGLAHPSLENFSGRHMTLTFEDLVSLRMVAIFRQYGHSLQRIREIEEFFPGANRRPTPFATRDIWVDHGDIFAVLRTQLVSGIRGGQAAFEFLRKNLDQVSLGFDDQRRANAWYPHRNVALRPTIQWGEPCVDGTRIPTRILWGMMNRGATAAEVASDYDLDERKVKDAWDWGERLQKVA